MYSKKGVVLYLFYLLHFWSQFDSSKLTVIAYVSSTVAYGGIRWHTARQKIIFKHVQKFCAYRTCALYDKQGSK